MSDLSKIHYALSIEPHLEQFTFDGRMRLTVTPAEPLDVLHLNALELDVTQCMAAQGNQTVQADVDRDPDNEALLVRLTPAVTETFTLKIDFNGVINDRMAGFYRSGYQWNEQTHFMAVTQFQESDALTLAPQSELFGGPQSHASILRW